jgi:hypothetical protein
MSGDEINGKLDELIIAVGKEGEGLIGAVEETSERLENIETLLVGEVKDSGKVGLLERIRKVEEWIAKREWFEKLIIVAIVGNAIGLVFLLIQNSLH